MSANYERSFERLMVLEGHHSNHSADPGGETTFGISKVHHPDMYTDDMPTRDDAKEFFRREFWDRLSLDELPLVVAGRLFDAAVNVGPSRAVRWLQEAVNELSSEKLEVDGAFGPKTKAAAISLSSVFADNLCGYLTWRQGHYYKNEMRDELYKNFGRGLWRRIGMPL